MKTNFTSFLLLTFLGLNAQQNCQEALAVSPGVHTVDAVDGILSAATCFTNNNNVDYAKWYSYTPTENQNVTISTDLVQNDLLDTRVSIFNGDCDNLNCHAFDDDSGEGYTSVVTFPVFAGETYYIMFDDRWSSGGFDFELSTAEMPEVPVYFSSQHFGNGNSRSCAVDMNGDYLDDIVAITGSNSIALFIQQADGSFERQNYTTSTFFMNNWSITAADMNGDLINDLLLGGGSGASILLSNGDDGYSVISSQEYLFSQRANFVDINNDGFLDAFICHDVEPNYYVMNSENETFTWHQGGLGDYPSGGNYGSIWVDYDNDGDQDLFIAKCRGGSNAKFNELHRNNGDGTFTEISESVNMHDPVQTWSSAWADFDHDGDFDAYIGASSFSDGIHRFMINEDGTFTDQIQMTGIHTFTGTGLENVAFDFDNDGWDDILTDAGGGVIFFNQGDMTFVEQSVAASGGAVADLNNDGFLDIYNNGVIYYNSGNDNNWLKIVTIGEESNTNGIGARIELTSALGTQIKEVRSGMGFSHAHTLNSHFGLGEDTQIESVVIRWPSGIVDTYYDVDINNTLFATEGETLSVTETQLLQDFQIYPNPAKDVLHLKTDANLKQTVYIYDVMGRMMQLKQTDGQVNISQLKSGVYFLKVYDAENRVYSRKFMVK